MTLRSLRSEGTSLAAGTLFGSGLATAQMTNPAKVLAFLDVAGSWDASLALVMGAALAVTTLGTRLARGAVGVRTGIDAKLIGGAALFGLGWGLVGLCPGPALAALATGSGRVLLFVVSMVAGMGLYRAALAGPLGARAIGAEHGV